jgi:hypothetical protein
MALSDTEKKFLREAIYVASQGANPTLSTALRQLNEMVLDDTYPSWTNKAVIDSAIGRSPGYQAAWDSLLRELKDAPPVGGDVPTVPDPPEYFPENPESPASVNIEAIVAELARVYDVHIQPRKIGVGIEPDADNPAALHIGGRAIASINGISNISGTDGQNPDYRHSNIFCVCDNDGGMRGVQYGHWFNGQQIRNTTNRAMSIYAIFDSMGNTCINGDTGGAGQDFYIVRDVANKKVILAAYKPGWTIEVRETSPDQPYSAMDLRKL